MINILRKLFGGFGLLILAVILVLPSIDIPSPNTYAPVYPFVDNLGYIVTVLWIGSSTLISFLMVFETPTRNYWLHFWAFVFELSMAGIARYGYVSVGEHIQNNVLLFGDIIFLTIVVGWPVVWLLDVLLTELHVWNMDTLE